MSKMKLSESLIKGREKFISILESAKDQWEIGERSKYGTAVRLFYEKRNDGANPSATVLISEDLSPEKIKAEDVADLLYERIVEKNEAVSMGINFMSNDVMTGKSTINPDMIEAVLAYSEPLKKYREKILNSHKINLLSMESVLIEKGFDENKLFDLKDDLITLGRKALLMNTDEDGDSPLHTSKNIVDHMLTTRFGEKMEKEGGSYKVMLDRLNEANSKEDKPRQRTRNRNTL